MTGAPLKENEEAMDVDEPEQKTEKEAPAVELNGLWFSYEVAEKINRVEGTSRERTWDGGLTIDKPRSQYGVDMEVGYQLQLKGITGRLPKGARCLVLGPNGAGKSTLMACIGGQHILDKKMARIDGRPVFHDLSLQSEVELVAAYWTQTIAFVGYNVPYQAMEVATLVKSASEGIDPKRVEHLKTLLGVDESWNLTKCSDGQRRRVQILCKLLKPRKVLLLDEITTDLDILARQNLLGFLKEESERGVTIIYATHIFDGLGDWYTHTAYLVDGELRFWSKAEQWPSPRPKDGDLFHPVKELFLKSSSLYTRVLGEKPTAPKAVIPENAAPAISVRNLTWAYSSIASHPTVQIKKRDVLRNLSFDLPRGSRCLLVGANGSGKTTLLNLLGGMHIYEKKGAIETLGHAAFYDQTKLNSSMTLLSGDWTRQVACVGNVTFQADMSAASMTQSTIDHLVRNGVSTELLAARRARLETLLALDPEWRMHKVSDGQRRRVQLLIKLLMPAQLLLLDEVTTDLDVLARQALLKFLHEESELRGVTVIYATHIFDGLDGFPTHILHVREGEVVTSAPKPPPTTRLLPTIRGWLETDLKEAAKIREERARAQAAAEAKKAPTPPPAPTKFASKFDRFGAGSRHNAYRF